MRACAAFISVCLLCLPAWGTPVVFWTPDRIGPGDLTMLYGGGLSPADAVLVSRLPDEAAKTPGEDRAPQTQTEPEGVRVIQASDSAVKFTLPAALKPGVFAVEVLAGKERSAVRLINRPELWFLQPTTLRPGLDRNQTPSGAEIQVIGKNFTIRGASTPRPKVVLRAKSRGAVTELPVVKAEPFSLTATVPESLSVGAYDLFVHNGHGGPAAWSLALAVEVKHPDEWSTKVFNVRDFGAKGDDVTDDTAAIRDALAAAGKNGGGVVYFPWGTYRLSDWVLLPARTVLQGQTREATLLKWPLDAPKDEKDFASAAVYFGSRCGIENLTLLARRVENLLFDVQVELNQPNSLPPDITPRVEPWGRSRDIFFRRLRVQHLLLAGRPEQQKLVTENPKLNKKYWEGLRNVRSHELHNFELSDSAFEGGDQLFVNVVNGRITHNTFANHMGYCWTNLGGGAHDVVCEGNDLQCSSSWGWGWIGIQRVYSAHNVSQNFVRGEREAMTLDISALPTARPQSQYWGTPVEVGGGKDKPFLRFPPPDHVSADGFRSGWTPGCFRGGSVIIHAFDGGTGGGQSRKILDNTADTVFLEKPFSPAPETTPRPRYLEVAPRHYRAHVGTTAWLGHLADSQPGQFTAREAHWVPQEFIGMTALVLDGKGAGQYRVVTANTADHATLDRPWDVTPDEGSIVGIWSLMRHMIVYDCQGYDASAFAQLYGSFYDYVVDGCQVERSQGIWGQCGWFVQFRDNTIRYAYSFHKGIGMPGPNPERNAPFGYTGLDNPNLRITKSEAYQYPGLKLPVFAKDVLPAPVPSTLGLMLRGNTLDYGQRLVVEPWSGDKPPGPKPPARFRDVVVDGNRVAHSRVGIQIGPDVEGVVLGRNEFTDVAQPLLEAIPGKAVRAPSGKKP